MRGGFGRYRFSGESTWDCACNVADGSFKVERSEDGVDRGESRWGELRKAGKRWKELREGWNNFESCCKDLS